MAATEGKTHATLRLAALVYLLVVTVGIWGYAVGRYHKFPYALLRPVLEEIDAFLKGGEGEDKSTIDRVTMDQQERNARHDIDGFVLRDATFRDPGYLLVSRYAKERGQVVVELVRIDGFRVAYTWVPPVEELVRRGNVHDNVTNSPASYRAQHPLLLPDGSLVFSSGEGPLARIDRDGTVVWVVNEHFHHSIELDRDSNLVVPVYLEPSTIDALPWLDDDGYAVISLSGRVLSKQSVGMVMLKNDQRGLYVGVGTIKEDRLHLNDAQPVLVDQGLARAGDIAISARHLSTVFLYRPSTGAIVWLKTGPWLSQHDVNLLGDGRVSVFGNDVFVTNRGGATPHPANPTSRVYVYDPSADHISRPYARTMVQAGMRSTTEGRSKVLANGDVFVEETNHDRLLRASADVIRWEYVNRATDRTTGALHWCRYLEPSQVHEFWTGTAPAAR